MFDCNECRMFVCIVCANVCHHGHDVVYEKYIERFCRCGAKGEESCNALIARTSKPSSIIERDDGKVKNRSSSRLTSRLSGDQKSFGKNIEETGEQEANLKDSSFNQKNEKDVSTMMSKTEFVEVMNEKIEDESEKLLKKNCSDDRINVE